jgi:ABC-type sugar transport system ATPase subunit
VREKYFEGKKMRSLSPKITGEFGIQIAHQGFGLVDHMNIARNLFLGKEPWKKV